MQSREGLSNEARGYKAAISNPNVSEEAKQHAREKLDQEYDGGNVQMTAEDGPSNTDVGKNPGNVAGGYKATINNPTVSDEAKKAAQEKLNSMSS